jgi:hypothetical protein
LLQLQRLVGWKVHRLVYTPVVSLRRAGNSAGPLLFPQINQYAVLQKEPARDKSDANVWNRSARNATQIAIVTHRHYTKIGGRLSSAEAEGTLGQYALMVKPTRAFLFRFAGARQRGGAASDKRTFPGADTVSNGEHHDSQIPLESAADRNFSAFRSLEVFERFQSARCGASL